MKWLNGNRISLFLVGFVTAIVLGGGERANADFTFGEEVATRIDEYLNTQVAAGQFSGSVLVANDGEFLISQGYGLANIEHGVPNTPLTKFRIGSITKQFTALSIMLFQERELLGVHEPISTYVIDCPEAWKAITIHHLLTHTSGIPNFTSFPEYMDHARLPQTIEETIDLFKDRPLRFAPGARFKYSNSGYVLLGFIIEVITGQSYEDFLRQNIFDPLGMSNSGYDSTRTLIMDRADGYVRENGILLNAVHIEMDTPHAAGALYSTVEDLFLWDRALYTTQLVSDDTLDAIFTPYTSTDLSKWYGYGYGYGWFIGEEFNRKVVAHSGLINGFGSFIGRYPQEGICIVILSNFQFAPIHDLAGDLTDIVKDVFDPMLIAHWALDETEGDIAYDSIGIYDGVVNGSALWQPTAGAVHGALEFDGIDDYVSTPFVLNPADGAFSAFAWIKGGAPGQVILSQIGEANWLSADPSGGNLMTGLEGFGRGRCPLVSQTVVTDGNWHRVGLTWDGSNRILYADDLEVAKDTQAQFGPSAGGLYIGAGKNLEPGSFFSGLIDDVRIYDRAITP